MLPTVYLPTILNLATDAFLIPIKKTSKKLIFACSYVGF